MLWYEYIYRYFGGTGGEERCPYLNEEEDIRLDAIRKDHWRYVVEEGDDENKIHALRW